MLEVKQMSTSIKNMKKPMFVLLVMHILIGLAHLVVFNLGHPLNPYTKNWPLLAQILVVSLYAMGIYLSVGFIVMIALNKNSDHMQGIGKALLVFSVLFLLVFLGIYNTFIFNNRQTLWLIYSFVNPLFGTAMYNRIPETTMGIFWVVSTVVPGFGFLTGMVLAVKQGRLEK